MPTLHLELDRFSTDIVIEPGTLDNVGQLLRKRIDGQNRHAVLVSDETVGALYAPQVLDSLNAAELEVSQYRFPPGEASKCLSEAERLYRFLAEIRLSRDGVLVALGGGVVSDLTGFVAATWMRGIQFAICPTTLEADVDASVGGKTGVNLSLGKLSIGKNLVGAFHHPVLVAIDPRCLKSLDPRDVRAGLAESVKHALVFSEDFLQWHESNVVDLLALDDSCLTHLITENLRTKSAIVEQDQAETGNRRILLNFGHTIGHALESHFDYRYRHGECVSLGMVAACRLSSDLGLLDGEVTKRAERLLESLGLPTRLEATVDASRILALIDLDKKRRNAQRRFVLLKDVGQPVIRSDVPDDAIDRAIQSLQP